MTVVLALFGVAVVTGGGAVASATPTTTTTTRASAALTTFNSRLKAHGVAAIACHPGTLAKKGAKLPSVKKATKPPKRDAGRSPFLTNLTMRAAFLAFSRLLSRHS